MIDTIKFSIINARWRESFPQWWDWRDSGHVERKVRGTKATAQCKTGTAVSRFLTHQETGVRVWGNQEEGGVWLECSLPRVLFRVNGMVIRNQYQLDAAYKLLGEMVSEVLEEGWEYHHHTRCDPVWQFAGKPSKWIAAHRNYRHPRVRNATVEHKDQGLVWPGSDLHLRMYDKHKEVTGRSGEVVRVEPQMRGKMLKEYLPSLSHVFDFDLLYQAFRNVCLDLQPHGIDCPANLAELLSLLQAEGITIRGQDPVDVWGIDKHRSTVCRMKKQIAAARSKTFSIDWRKLLPADGPPVAVDVVG